MKKWILSIALISACAVAAAQKQMVVSTEKIFKALPKYNEAIAALDKQAESYQASVDDKYNAIEKMFNDYQAQKSFMTSSARKIREDAISRAEEDAEKYQEGIFGSEGEMMKKRIETIKPIQDEVFKAISTYAQANGYTVVLDITNNPTVIYHSPSIDKTEEIIKLVKK